MMNRVAIAAVLAMVAAAGFDGPRVTSRGHARAVARGAPVAGTLPADGATAPRLTVARLQYEGGGDWYANPSSLPNLLKAIRERTAFAVDPAEVRVTLMDDRLWDYPFLHATGHGNMLDNTFAMHGSASSSFHLSRNYPIISAGGKNLGFTNGRYLKFGKGNEDNQAGAGIDTDAGWQSEAQVVEEPLALLFITLLQRMGIETESFAGITGTLSRV